MVDVNESKEVYMKWVTRERVKVDRVACPWLITKFIDPEDEFLFVPPEHVMEVSERETAIPFDVTGVELGHRDGRCSFESIIDKYEIKDPAIKLLSRIVHGADVSADLYGEPEAPGLKAIAEGFRHLGWCLGQCGSRYRVELHHALLESQG